MSMEPGGGGAGLGEALAAEAVKPAQAETGHHRVGLAPAAKTRRSAHERAEARRLQVLAAAGECFRSHGFHGTSMAQISKAASMSPGHIYHYFKNKEDIILAIVRMDMHDTLNIIRERQDQGGDWQQAMLAGVAHGVRRMYSLAKSSMALEVMSEAAHNPRVAQMIRELDQIFRREIGAILARGIQSCDREVSEKELEARIEVMCATFGGLTMRAICNPHADLPTMIRVVGEVMHHLISH